MDIDAGSIPGSSTSPSDIDRALGAVLAIYQQRGQVANDELYEAAREPLGLSAEDLARREPVGRSGQHHNLARRRLRWAQQSLKHMNVIERVQRGVWRLRTDAEKELTPAQDGMVILGFSTKLGLALWANCDALASIEEPIGLLLTSPPYPVAKGRRYGRFTAAELVDFVCRAIDPLLPKLLPGASVVINTTNDCFEAGSPARSTYLEELILAIRRLGLHLMDRIVWTSPKPPGPVQWASKTRQQLNVAWEPVLWFTNDPFRCFADNRRVLQPHSERHLRLIARGGEQRNATYQDGAYRIRAGASFANATAGSIPRNVLHFAQNDGEVRQLRDDVRRLHLPVHGALMPLKLARFLIKFLTREGDLVCDMFSGWGTTARAAEDTGRRWAITERFAEYVAAQAVRMRGAEGFKCGIPVNVLPLAALC
jgi:DNA modification methylase